MICLRTTDDWTTATITTDDGGGPQVFTPTSAVKDARAAAVEFAAFLTATYGVATTIEYLRIAATGATIRISNPDPYTITYSTAGLAIYGGVDGVDAQFVWTGPSGAVAGLVAPGSEESRIYLSQPVKTTPGVRLSALSARSRLARRCTACAPCHRLATSTWRSYGTRWKWRRIRAPPSFTMPIAATGFRSRSATWRCHRAQRCAVASTGRS
jgi:hypothetical protein